MMTKFYINDLIENKDGRLYVVCEIQEDLLGVVSIPLGEFYAWVDIKDVKKIGNYPYLIPKLNYIERRLEKFKEYEHFVLSEILYRINNDELLRKDSIFIRTYSNRVEDLDNREQIIDEYDYDFYGDEWEYDKKDYT